MIRERWTDEEAAVYTAIGRMLPHSAANQPRRPTFEISNSC